MGCAELVANVPLGPALVVAMLAGVGMAACSSDATAPAPTNTPSDGVVSSEDVVSGGQSGGEGEGNLDYSGPCACLFSGVLGEVLEPQGPCSRVRVLDTFDVFPNLAVGEVLGGVLHPACSGSEPIGAGDQILFQYFPPSGADECPERSACWQTCTEATPECGKACASATAEVCADDVALAHQTGSFSALTVRDDRVRFHFAGQDRAASIDEVLDYTCSNEHQRILDEYEREHPRLAVDDTPIAPTSSLQAPETAVMPAASPDPSECYSATN
jgi:hypothetical protein